jgi:hypothetical protein
MSVVELEVFARENGCVRFRIAEQGRKELYFAASNGIEIKTVTLPQWLSSEDTLYLRGTITSRDQKDMLATKEDFGRIEEALAEANVAWAKPEPTPEPAPAPEPKAAAVADQLADHTLLERCYLAAITGLCCDSTMDVDEVPETAWEIAEAATTVWRERTAPGV